MVKWVLTGSLCVIYLKEDKCFGGWGFWFWGFFVHRIPCNSESFQQPKPSLAPRSAASLVKPKPRFSSTLVVVLKQGVLAVFIFFPVRAEHGQWGSLLVCELKVLEKIQDHEKQRFPSSAVCQKGLGKGGMGTRDGQQRGLWAAGGEENLQEHQGGGQGFSGPPNSICCLIPLCWSSEFWAIGISGITGVPAGRYSFSSSLTEARDGGLKYRCALEILKWQRKWVY